MHFCEGNEPRPCCLQDCMQEAVRRKSPDFYDRRKNTGTLGIFKQLYRNYYIERMVVLDKQLGSIYDEGWLDEICTENRKDDDE